MTASVPPPYPPQQPNPYVPPAPADFYGTPPAPADPAALPRLLAVLAAGLVLVGSFLPQTT